MMRTSNTLKKVRPQIRKFIETANALRDGETNYFSITRLTSLKSLCKNHKTAIKFVAFLAEKTLQRIQGGFRPEYNAPADWERYKKIVGLAVQNIQEYLKGPNSISSSTLRKICKEAEAVQIYDKKKIWGHPIRIIHSKDVLIVENALRCIMEPMNAPYWAYQTARNYTERYNPNYGTGLIPESVPMLDDIIKFWLAQE